MEVLLIVALLASNIYLIGKVLKKPAEKHPPAPATNSEETPSPASSGPDDDSLVGRSHYDMDRLNALIDAKVNSRVDEKVDEIVTRIRTELTSPEDVGLPPEEPAQPEQEKTIPQERLDEVFTHHTVGESFGDAPEITERQTGGQDFKALESAVRVAKDEPHTPKKQRPPRRRSKRFREPSSKNGCRLIRKCARVSSRLSTATRMSRLPKRSSPRRKWSIPRPSTLLTLTGSISIS